MTTLFELAAKLQAAHAAEGLLILALKATVILAVARILLASMPRASAATKHVVATAALVAVGTMPFLSMMIPSWELGLIRPRVEAPQKAAERQAPTVGVTDADDSTASTAVAVARAIAPAPLSALERATNVFRATWKGAIVLAIAIASLLLLVHMALGMLGVWFVARKAESLYHDDVLRELDAAREQLEISSDVRLKRSGRISVPVLWGVFNPVLLLPPDVIAWPADRLRVVLLHELAHLKRFDGVSLIATRIAVSLFWFHPIAWSLERAGRSECERACDDLVLAGGTKPSEYADHLLAIARSMPSFDPFRSVTLAMSRKSQLEGRLLSILQPQVARRVFGGTGVAVACALAVAVIVPIAAMRLIAQPPRPPQPPATPAGTTVTVTPDEDQEVVVEELESNVESLADFFLAQLGKFDKRADRLARTPTNGREWYQRAFDYYNLERFAEAGPAFETAARLGHNADTALYNAACSYALIGDANRSIDALRRALEAGWDDVGKIAEDSDFDPIRSDPRFAQALRDTTGNIATRRLTETQRRYTKLKTQPAPRDEDEWYEVGLDLLRLRKYDESIHAFEQSIANRANITASMYNIACAYSLRGDAQQGMLWLDRAVEHGYSNDEKFANDPDLALLRKQPGFNALRDKAKDLKMKGCCAPSELWNLIGASNWDEATKHHRRMAAKRPTSGRAWFNLGFTALQARDFPAAHEGFNKALALRYRPDTTSYNIACTYALQGNRDAAFAWLGRAKAAGFKLDRHIKTDDDLDSLHRDPRWKQLVEGL